MDETLKPLKVPPQMSYYADKHNLSYLMQSLVASLVTSQPDDPISHLIDLLKSSNMSIPRVVLLGPPAVGKHTLARHLSVQLEAVHVTTETLLPDQSELSTLSEQGFAELLVQLVQQRLKQPDCVHQGWILVGIPQTRLQALLLQQAGIIPEHVVLLVAPTNVLLTRNQRRSVDLQTDSNRTSIRSADDIIAGHQERGGLSEEQLLAKLQLFHCEVTGLRSAYRHILKVIDGNQLDTVIYLQALAFIQTHHHFRTPRILLMGPPGSGKSHQAKLLSEKYKMTDVCCSRLLRSVAANGSGLGAEIQQYLENEQSVPDSLVLQAVEQRLSQVDCSSRGWVLHGFPYNLHQARNLRGFQHQPNRVFFLEVTDDVCLERTTLRRTDWVSGERYHTVTRPPQTAVQNRLQAAPDDSAEVMRERLERYRAESAGLQSVFPDAFRIDAAQKSHNVFEALERRLNTN
nr:adenylate kinase 8 [Nothobranchius furzeri]XP_054586315.1 adenylate kinase 8 [Nothobranchius furzeri]